MVRAATFWFLSLWTALFASLDILFISYDIEPGKHSLYLLITVVFQLMVVRRWGPQEDA